MKQVIQSLKNGQLSINDIPAPTVAPGHVLIGNQRSLVSAGTEKMIVDLSRKSLLGKARERPDQVRKVLDKVRSEGLKATIEQVQKKLDTPTSMGYSSAGVVISVGDGVQHFKPGDRVASNGPHAEVVSIPQNLCAKVPPNVTFDQACFAVLGSIALQGVRLSKTNVGETVLVIGLGLVGQLTVSILKAAGIRVAGSDPDPEKCRLAQELGADIATPSLSASDVEQYTSGLGADAVLITASTKSNQPIEFAAAAVRAKGRVVLVGVVGLELDRRPFYFKEAEFVVSCSYGPGRYDPKYEEQGIDYPPAYVRWTEQRNIQAVLNLMEQGSVDPNKLISHRYAIENGEEAYAMINRGSEPYLGILLEYPPISDSTANQTVALKNHSKPAQTSGNGQIPFGLLGAGNFAQVILLPAIEKSECFEPVTICSAKGMSGTHLGETSGFKQSTTDESTIFESNDISAVFSITRHNQHADHVRRAIETGKDIFVEKPLCLSIDELAQIDAALTESKSPPRIMVGFNRRFAPSCVQLKQAFKDKEPLTVSIRFNAGAIPADHWSQDDIEGGGRIIGEACHAIDLATYLTGSLPVRVYAESVGNGIAGGITDDQCLITLRHENGSISSIAYISSGSKTYPKERIEVFGGGSIGVINDYRSLELNTGGGTKETKMRLDKGHNSEMRAWGDALRSGNSSPITWNELRSVTLASILAVRSLREGMPFDLVIK